MRVKQYLVSAPVPVASNGSFTVTANGKTISGKIVGDGVAVGGVAGTSFCSGDGDWEALKKK